MCEVPTARRPCRRRLSTGIDLEEASRVHTTSTRNPLPGPKVVPIPSMAGPWCAAPVGHHDEERVIVIAAWRCWLRARLRTTRPPGDRDDALPLAGALVADTNGRVLLIHRNMSEMSWWEVPGGKVEQGEHPWQAARRELVEELNVIVELVAEVGTEQFRQGEQRLQYTWYLARVRGGAPELVEKDRFDAFRYFTWDEVHALRDASPSVRCLRDRRADTVRQVLSEQPRSDLVL